MATRKKSVLTEKEEAFKEALLDGNTPRKAALVAGYSGGTPPKSEDVRLAVAEARKEIADIVQIKRADMVAVMLDAIDMARLLADPQAMIKGASELSKMLGFYEPEVKKVELTAPQMRNRTRLMAMSDEDLLRLIDEEGVIDVEFTEVPPSAH